MNISYFPNPHYWLPLLENLEQSSSVASNTVRDFLSTLFLVEISCLDKQIQHLINLYFWWLLLLFFFQFFALLSWMIAVIYFAIFILTKHFCKSSNTCGSSTHFANVWHADKTEAVISFEIKSPFKVLLQFTLFETLIWKYF